MENKGSLNKKTLNKIFLICLGVFLAACVGLGIYIFTSDYQKLGRRISVFKVSVSRLSVDEAAEKLTQEFADRQVVFYEDGEACYTTTLADLGYSLNTDSLKSVLTDIQKQRTENWTLFSNKVNYTLPYQVEINEETEKEALSTSHFGDKERVASTDATVVYDENQKQFVATASSVGTQIDEARLQNYVDTTLNADFEEALLGEDIRMDMTTEVYMQPTTEESETIVNKLSELNGQLNAYRSTVLTYTFGSSTEVLDGTTIESWIQIDGDTVSINQDSVNSYVSDLAVKYDSIYSPRTFTTSYGNQVTVSDNEYGYQIDQTGEAAQLLSDLSNGGAISREPVYSISGWQRNGTDDLAGSYIEVSLDNQHLWLYKDGVLITETDIVSGAPTEERETYRGAWPIAYKASPYTLTSDIYGYTTTVQYWMPFVYGQGLHDASWQSSFGGNNYKTGAGSHGCINLPTSAAAEIYNNIDGGYPIIIY